MSNSCWAMPKVLVAGRAPANAADPLRVGSPATSVMSLMNVGTPAKAPPRTVRARSGARS